MGQPPQSRKYHQSAKSLSWRPVSPSRTLALKVKARKPCLSLKRKGLSKVESDHPVHLTMSLRSQSIDWRANRKQFSVLRPSVILFCREMYWNRRSRIRQPAITQPQLNTHCTRTKQWLHSRSNPRTSAVNRRINHSKIQSLNLKLSKIAHKVSLWIKSNHLVLELTSPQKWGYKSQMWESHPSASTLPDSSMKKSH